MSDSRFILPFCKQRSQEPAGTGGLPSLVKGTSDRVAMEQCALREFLFQMPPSSAGIRVTRPKGDEESSVVKENEWQEEREREVWDAQEYVLLNHSFM